MFPQGVKLVLALGRNSCHEDFFIGLSTPTTWQLAALRVSDPRKSRVEFIILMTQLWKSHTVTFTVVSNYTDQAYYRWKGMKTRRWRSLEVITETGYDNVCFQKS